MKLRRRAELTCSRCGASEWAGKPELCVCGKERTVSNWSYTLAGRERSTGTKVRARAEQIAAKAKTAYDEEGVRALRSPKTIPTLEKFSVQFLEYVDAAQTLKPKTKLSYRNGWRLLSKTPLAKMRLTQIGTADADVVKFPGSGSNANQALRTLSRMLSYACTLDWRKDRPVINLREERKRNILIDQWLEDLILEMAPPKLCTILTVMGQCGMRPDEVFPMRWEHMRWQENGVLVPEGKTDAAERWVPMSQRMKDELTGQKARNERRAKLRNQMPSEWVFPSSSATGHYTNISGVWARTMVKVRAAAKKRKLPDVPDGLVPYDFRHMFATHFLEASGNNQAALKKIMGHSSMRITERYLHPGVKEAAAVMDVFNNNRRGLRLVKEA